MAKIPGKESNVLSTESKFLCHYKSFQMFGGPSTIFQVNRDYVNWHHYARYCVKSVRIRSYSCPYSVRMRENADKNNSEYEHFSRSEIFIMKD